MVRKMWKDPLQGNSDEEKHREICCASCFSQFTSLASFSIMTFLFNYEKYEEEKKS